MISSSTRITNSRGRIIGVKKKNTKYCVNTLLSDVQLNKLIKISSTVIVEEMDYLVRIRYINLSLLLLSLSVYVQCTCWHGNAMVGSYGHDIIVWESKIGVLRIAFGEVPRWAVQYPMFYNTTTSLTRNDVWSSITWDKNVKLSDAFPDSLQAVRNSTSGLISSGYMSTCNNGCSISGSGIVLMPRNYNINSTNLGQQEIYMIGMNLRDDLIVDESVCEGVIKYLSVGRYDIYDNWRFARYSLILLVSSCIGIVVYYSYPNRITLDRLFRSCFCVISGMLYSILGLIFISDSRVITDFQAVEYVYYIVISVVYFGSFIRYMFRKILQDKTASFYHNSLTGGGKGLEALKNNSMEMKINVNNILNSLVSKTPRSFTNVVILWVVFLLASPGIHIIVHDTLRIVPYNGYVLSITIIKFLVPIITTCAPAIIIFILSIIDYVRRDKNRKIGKYFSVSEDPLLYRIEFISCLLVCLPSAIITFIIGNLDSVMPPYILTARWYHLTFHAMSYITFDITYLFIISGTLSIIMSLGRNNVLDLLDVKSTTTGTKEDKKRTRREVVLDLMLKDTTGYHGFVSNFAMRTDNYIPLGIRDWIMDINTLTNSDADQAIKNLVTYYINVQGVKKSFINVLYPRGIVNPDSIVGYSDIQGLKNDIINEMESNLFSRLIYDGIEDTDIYQEYVSNNRILINETITNLKQVNHMDDRVELEDLNSIEENDMACSTDSV